MMIPAPIKTLETLELQGGGSSIMRGERKNGVGGLIIWGIMGISCSFCRLTSKMTFCFFFFLEGGIFFPKY